MPKRLLILSCSQHKRLDPGKLPAIERYDGPLFRVLRKYIREKGATTPLPDIFILSAHFGLISTHQLIPVYDHKMTSVRAKKLHPFVLPQLQSHFHRIPCEQLFLGLSKLYLEAINGYEAIVPATTNVVVSQGSMGRRQAELYDWLYNNEDRDTLKLKSPRQQTSEDIEDRDLVRTASIRGVTVSYSPDQILGLARQRLINDDSKARNYQSWYVQVDHEAVAPKWLVSQLTGLKVGAFHTGEARRFLEDLGIFVSRT